MGTKVAQGLGNVVFNRLFGEVELLGYFAV
jgi:hypothetical protein